MKSSARRFRPMGVSQILDETVELYKSSFVLLVGISSVMYVPYAVLTQFALAEMMDFSKLARGSVADVYLSAGLMVIGYLYLIVSAIFVTGAMTYAISEGYLGRKVTIIESFRRVLRTSVVGPLLGAILVKAAVFLSPALVIGLIIALVVSAKHAIWMAVLIGVVFVSLFFLCYVLLRLALTESVVVLEMKGIRHALSRTWRLMPGSMMKYLSLIVLSYLVIWMVSSIIGGPTQALLLTNLDKGTSPSVILVLLSTLISAVVGTVLAPVASIVTILMYYDIRIRKEGFDLEMLAQELSSAPTPGYYAPNLPREQSPYEAGPEQ